MTNASVLRSRSSRIWFWLTITLLALLALETLRMDSSLETKVPSFGLITLIGSSAYMVFWRPRVVIFDEGVMIVNPVKEFIIGWAEVDSIDTKYAFSVERAGKVIQAWAAPAPTRRRGGPSSPPQIHLSSDHPDTLSGGAAEMARERQRAFVNSGVESATYVAQWRLIAPVVWLLSLSAIFLR